jgi:hypothetical protein
MWKWPCSGKTKKMAGSYTCHFPLQVGFSIVFLVHSINQLPGESFGCLVLTIGHSLRQPWQCAPQYYIYIHIYIDI